MKTIKLLAVAILTTFYSFSYASNNSGVDNVGSKSTTTLNNIRDYITNQITFPRTILSNYFEGEVLVSFTINQNNQLVITDIKSSDSRLISHVEKELKNVEIENASDFVNEPLVIKLVFRKNIQ